jgi:hypothetical protein
VKQKLIRAILRTLDAAPTYLRRKLGISRRNQIIWSWEYGDIDDDLVVVADGYGGATLERRDDHNGDDDYLLMDSRTFTTESEACDVADQAMNDEISLSEAFETDVPTKCKLTL